MAASGVAVLGGCTARIVDNWITTWKRRVCDHQNQNYVRSVCGGLVLSLTGEPMSSKRCLRVPSVRVVAVRSRCHALVLQHPARIAGRGARPHQTCSHHLRGVNGRRIVEGKLHKSP